MEKQHAIDRIKETCNLLSREMMKLQPLIPHLRDSEAQKQMFEAVFKLTSDIETIKKLAIQLQGKDESSVL